METLEYSYAGFLPGILFRNNEPMVLKGTGQPLFHSFKLELDTFHWHCELNDKIVFFTDGLYELLQNDSSYLGYDDVANEIKKIKWFEFIMNH
mgnify:CR=1 FL=1